MLNLSEVFLFFSVATTFMTLAVAQRDRCEDGWYPISSKTADPFYCARFVTDRMEYDVAAAHCETIRPDSGRNGELATILDAPTNRRVTEVIRTAVRGPYLAWIGLRKGDENDDGEAFFRWLNRRRLRGYENWAPDTPNNDKARGGQDCVYINDYRKEGTWNDFECQALLQFVCQYETFL